MVAMLFLALAAAASAEAYRNVKESTDGAVNPSLQPNYKNIRDMNAILYGGVAGVASLAVIFALWGAWLNMHHTGGASMLNGFGSDSML